MSPTTPTLVRRRVIADHDARRYLRMTPKPISISTHIIYASVPIPIPAVNKTCREGHRMARSP